MEKLFLPLLATIRSALIPMLLCLPTVIHAQDKDSLALDKLNKSISKTLARNNVALKIKDSIALYSYSITIKISKNKEGVQSDIQVSNPILYDYFTQLDQLSKLDYSPLLLKRQNQTFLIPILVLNQSATAPNRYTKQEGKLMIDMQLVEEQLNQMLFYMVSPDADTTQLILKPFIIKIFNIR